MPRERQCLLLERTHKSLLMMLTCVFSFSQIDWKEGKDLTTRVETKKQRNKSASRHTTRQQHRVLKD